MSTNAAPEATPAGETNAAAVLVETVTKMAETQTKVNDRLESLEKSVEEARKPQYPFGVPGAFGIRKGEDPLTSRPYSLMRLAKALKMRQNNTPGWDEHAKVELDLSKRLGDAYYTGASWAEFGSGVIMPLASDLMPTEDRQTNDGKLLKGMSRELVAECQQIMKCGGSFDADELAYVMAKAGMPIAKDLSAHTATTGGNLVAAASQGELIELLRSIELFSRAGAMTIDLPPQGSITFPRVTGSVTIAATSEGATISESTPSFGALTLQAKPYSGFTDIPDELFRFSTSVAVESWLRSEFAREIALKADRDMINGLGGTSIRGIVNYSGITTVIAGTTGGNGDTLLPEDPVRLYAQIADDNAPVDRGFFFAMTNTLWAGLTTKKASTSGEFMFAVATQSVGGGRPAKSLNGETVLTSTQIPVNRTKGSGTTLTLLLGGVGPEWMIARAGVVEVAMTNSDSTKFQNRISTLRGTQYIDAGPRHEASFGMIDDLLNQ